jgi:transcriptional regulator with XRE-family HTH domain
MNNDRIHFSDLLKQLRKQKGLTQRELGAKILRNTGYISRLEVCNQRPSADDIELLSKIFGVNLTAYLPTNSLDESEGEGAVRKAPAITLSQDKVKGFPTAVWMWKHTHQHSEADVLKDLHKKLNRLRGSYADRASVCYITWGPGVKESVVSFLKELHYTVDDIEAESKLTIVWKQKQPSR